MNIPEEYKPHMAGHNNFVIGGMIEYLKGCLIGGILGIGSQLIASYFNITNWKLWNGTTLMIVCLTMAVYIGFQLVKGIVKDNSCEDMFSRRGMFLPLFVLGIVVPLLPSYDGSMTLVQHLLSMLRSLLLPIDATNKYFKLALPLNGMHN